MKTLWAGIKREPVLTAALVAAGVSCCFVPPDAAYFGYIDFRTLALLYALMAVVAGLRSAGAFQSLAHALCGRVRSVRGVGAVLVCLCFFTSMLVTNDVALLTFVPFAAVVLGLAGRGDALLRVVVLQTAAANLGSILTPVGNPQNLYLYGRYGLTMGQFLAWTFPVWALSLVLLLGCCRALPRAALRPLPPETDPLRVRTLVLYGALFGLCLLTVVRVLPWPALLGILVAVLLLFDRKTLLKPDFCLLLTFVGFFVFAGNLARVPGVDGFLRAVLSGREYPVALLTSQVISNVPAAVLLSGFTQNARGLLLGVDIGGLGTPIASLASLIGFKLYLAAGNARPGRFLLEFTLLNGLLLGLLSAFWLLLPA